MKIYKLFIIIGLLFVSIGLYYYISYNNNYNKDYFGGLFKYILGAVETDDNNRFIGDPNWTGNINSINLKLSDEPIGTLPEGVANYVPPPPPPPRNSH